MPGSSTEGAPSASVVGTVRNGAATFPEVIDSIRAQDMDDRELVVDDGSSDRTAALAADLAAQDPRSPGSRPASSGASCPRAFAAT